MSPSAQPPSRLLAAWSCLLAWCLSATPLPAFTTALVAWVDGEHRVAVTSVREGTRVVLGHEEHDPRRALTHAHCAVSRVLTLLAESTGPEHADHVLNFQRSGSVPVRGASLWVAAPRVQPAAANPALPVFLLARFIPDATLAMRASLLGLPPPTSISVTVARVILLLV